MHRTVLVGHGSALPLTVVGVRDAVGGILRIGIDLCTQEVIAGDLRIVQGHAVNVLRDLIPGIRVLGDECQQLAPRTIAHLGRHVLLAAGALAPPNDAKPTTYYIHNWPFLTRNFLAAFNPRTDR